MHISPINKKWSIAFVLLNALLVFSCSIDPDSVNDTGSRLSNSWFVHLTVNGNIRNYDVPPDSATMLHPGNSNILIHYAHQPLVAFGEFSFTGAGIGAGTTQTLVNFALEQPIAYLTINNPPVNVAITEYGTVGQYIAGNFSGSFTGPAPTSTIYNITCSFRVRRAY